MNPDYRYLGEESRHHRWNMPGSPIVETFAEGKPLTLTIQPSRVQEARLNGTLRFIPQGRFVKTFEISDRLADPWRQDQVTALILWAKIFPVHIISGRLKKDPYEIRKKANELDIALEPITDGWNIKQLSHLFGIVEATISKWILAGTLVSMSQESYERHRVSRDHLVSFVLRQRYRSHTLKKVDPKVLDWIAGFCP